METSRPITGPPGWFYYAVSAGAIVLLVALYFMLRPQYTPQGATRYYFSALQRGQCAKAYRTVSFYAKKNYPRYSTYSKFKENVCIPTHRKYDYLFAARFLELNVRGDSADMICLIKFKTSFMPRRQYRPFPLNLRREGRKWKLDGPQLEP